MEEFNPGDIVKIKGMIVRKVITTDSIFYAVRLEGRALHEHQISGDTVDFRGQRFEKEK